MNVNVLALLISCIVSFVAVLFVRKVRNHTEAHRQVGQFVLSFLLDLETDHWAPSAWIDISLMDMGENVNPDFLVHLLRHYERHGVLESVVRVLPWIDGAERKVRLYRLTSYGREHWREYV